MKRLLLILALTVLPTTVFAQAAPSNLMLNVTVADAQQILNALAAEPWKDVNGLMQKLIAQVNQQTAPKPPTPPAPTPKPESKAKPIPAPAEKPKEKRDAN